jgi:hypothetical protein
MSTTVGNVSIQSRSNLVLALNWANKHSLSGAPFRSDLIPNGSADDGTTNWGPSWSATLSSVPGYKSSKAIRATQTNANFKGLYTPAKSGGSFVAGERYFLSFWARCSRSDGLLRIAFGGTGDGDNVAGYVDLPYGKEWQYFEFPCTTITERTAGGSLTGSIRFYDYTPGNSVNTWMEIDEVKLYPIDNWYDLSGNNNHGILMGGATFDTTGVKFESSSQSKIRILNHPSLQIDGDLTISVVSQTPTSVPEGRAQGGVYKSYNFEYEFGPYEGVSRFSWYHGDGMWEGGSGTSYAFDSVNPQGTFNHFVVVRDVSEKKLHFYRDGVYLRTNGYTRIPTQSNADVYLGARNTYLYYNGYYRAVHIFNAALSGDHVSRLHETVKHLMK